MSSYNPMYTQVPTEEERSVSYTPPITVPYSLKYELKNTTAVSRSYTSNVQLNGSLTGYTGGTTCNILIPTGHNLCLVPSESVLKFSLALTADASNRARLDSCGAHGIIQRIRIYHGSNLLEDIETYGLIAKAYNDLMVSNDSIQGKYSILAETRRDMYTAVDVSLNGLTQNVNTGALLSNST